MPPFGNTIFLKPGLLCRQNWISSKSYPKKRCFWFPPNDAAFLTNRFSKIFKKSMRILSAGERKRFWSSGPDTIFRRAGEDMNLAAKSILEGGVEQSYAAHDQDQDQDEDPDQDQDQEDVDGARLTELERSLDGLYDEIMTPSTASSQKLAALGEGITLPQRAWKKSKPFRDDIWRNDVAENSNDHPVKDGTSNGNQMLLPTKTSSAEVFRKEKDISSPLSSKHEPISPRTMKDMAERQDVDEWCMRSEEEDDDDDGLGPLLRTATIKPLSLPSDTQTETSTSPAPSKVVSEQPLSPALSSTKNWVPPTASHHATLAPPFTPTPLSSSKATYTAPPRSPPPSLLMKIFSICFWLSCVFILFCIGLFTLASLDPEADPDSSLVHRPPVWKSLHAWEWPRGMGTDSSSGGGVVQVLHALEDWYWTCPEVECGRKTSRAIVEIDEYESDNDNDSRIELEAEEGRISTQHDTEGDDDIRTPSLERDVTFVEVGMEDEIFETPPSTVSNSTTHTTDESTEIPYDVRSEEPFERISIRIKLKSRMNVSATPTAKMDNSNDPQASAALQIIQSNSFSSRIFNNLKRFFSQFRLKNIKLRFVNIFHKLRLKS